MTDRDPTEQVQLKIRLRGKLLARLEAEAKSNGYPLNTEIARHLENAIRENDLGRVVFGGEERFGLLATFDRLILAIEMTTGKTIEDRATRDLAADTICSFMKHGPEIVAAIMAGKPLSPSVARSVADRYALTTIATMINKDIERRTEDAADAGSSSEGERQHG